MKLREVMAELIFFAGVAMIAAGMWQWSWPLALVFIGLVCVFIGWNMASPRLAKTPGG